MKIHWKAWLPFLRGAPHAQIRALALERFGIDINKGYTAS
jgi:hypothetical protein